MASPIDATAPPFHVAGLPFPATQPKGYPPSDHEADVFDPAVHLALAPPPAVRALVRTDNDPVGADSFTVPVPSDASYPGLAFSEPFQVLSAEGVAAMRRSIAEHEPLHAHATRRQPKAMRGLGYLSHFARALAYDPSVLKCLEAMSGTPMWPENHAVNNPQINFGEVGTAKAVDEWHLDSVPFVMVLVLSDLQGMEGGDLKVARLADAKRCLELIHDDALPEDKIATAKYPAAGWAILMQGSKIAHTVTPVLAAREPRMSAVFSYQSLDCFRRDDFVYKTFTTSVATRIDAEVLAAEHSRHIAWRVSGQLQCLIERPLWGDTAAIRAGLLRAAAELVRAERLVAGEDVGEAHMSRQTAPTAMVRAAESAVCVTDVALPREEEEGEVGNKRPRA